jgi:hypothetical protein
MVMEMTVINVPTKTIATKNDGMCPMPQRPIKRYDIVDRRGGVQKDFRQPRDQDQDENEHVIPFHPAPDCFQFRDFEAGQNQIFAYELFPFALEQFAIFHDHRDKKMRFSMRTRARKAS